MQVEHAKWIASKRKDSFEITFMKKPLLHLCKHRQGRLWGREAGGQLFGYRNGKKYTVEIATGPRESDQRTRYLYVPDREKEQEEIEQHLKQGIIYLGDWHTHAEKVPHPSSLDIESINDCFRKSKHNMPGYALVIVGFTKNFTHWYVGMTNRAGTRQLSLDKS